jgi:MFS transporter, FSR family, fosmidomycin resistance protein
MLRSPKGRAPCLTAQGAAFQQTLRNNPVPELIGSAVRNVALYFAKFLITSYTSILPPLLPVMMREMNLSLTQAGGLVSFFSLFNSILQPLLGWVEDRLGYHRFLCLAPLWVGLFLGALGFAVDFGSLAIFLFLAGIGICAFHPASFAAVKGFSPENRPVIISFLLMAASLGFVAGPSLVTLCIDQFGMGRLYLISIPGLLATVALFAIIPQSRDRRHPAKGFDYPVAKIIGPIFPFFLFALAVSITAMNLYSFVPIYLKQKGASVGAAGLFLSVFSLGCALGPLAGSLAAKRIGSPRVMALSALLSAPSLLLFIGVQPAGTLQAVIFFFLGLFLMLPFSILIGMAQERVPQYVGTVSSFLGGFVWGCGGVLVILFAGLAERIGIEWLLGGLVLFPLFSLALVLTAPALRVQAPQGG